MSHDAKAFDAAERACQSLRATLGENLVTFAVYGSAARSDMVCGTSDINVLIVLERSTPESHRAIAEQLKGQPQIAPFVLSRWELPRSMPVFALKFRSIARHYRVLHGEDVLSGFAPSDDLLRFLCEQSLRNLRLRMEHAYIRNAAAPDRYAAALVRTTPALFVTLSEVLRTAGAEVPLDHASRPEVIGAALGCDASVLADLRALRAAPRKLSADEAFALHSRLFMLLSIALDWVREQWPTATTMA